MNSSSPTSNFAIHNSSFLIHISYEKKMINNAEAPRPKESPCAIASLRLFSWKEDEVQGTDNYDGESIGRDGL